MAAAPQPTVGILPEEADLHTAEARVNKHKADWRGWKFMWPFAVVFVFVFIIPIVYAIYISFFKKQMVGGTKFVGFENYARLIQDPQFWSSVGRVTIFTVFQVPIMLFLAAAMALALDSMKLHGTKFFRISTFLPYAVPAVVSTMIWGFVYGAKYGLVGSLNDFLGTNIDVLNPDVLVVMNQPSLDKFEHSVQPGGLVIVDSTLVPRIPDMPGVTVCAVPATALAEEAGLKGLANVILVGKLFAETLFCSEETIRAAVAAVVPARKKDKLAGNLRALELGVQA